MSNVLSEEKRQQVIALGRLGWTLRRIEEATGVRRETASAYLKVAGVAVRRPRGWGRHPPAKPANGVSTDPGEDSKPVKEVSTDSGVGGQVRRPGDEPASGAVGTAMELALAVPAPNRSPQASACEPHREFIELSLGRGRNAMAIWQDLVSFHAFGGQYAGVRRFVAKLREQQLPEARVVIVTEPGQEAQVDYGEGPMVRDPEIGKYRRTRLFVLTLGCSRKSVRLLTRKSSTRIWVELHERAFRRLGGCPKVIVLDNLREGVLKPDIYDPVLNPLYRDMLTHYGVIAIPCRVGDPDRKGKVESAVGHAQRTPLKGLRFEAMEPAQAYLDHWESRWADTRIHGTTKRQVAAMFAEEKPYLQALPLEPFRFYECGLRIVHLDGHIEVRDFYYSVPPGNIGRTVWVQWDEKHVRILESAAGPLLREHRRQSGPHRYRTQPQDQPTRTPVSTQQLLNRAVRAGLHIGALCEQIHRRDGEVAVRRILGVLSLVKKHGAATVDDACAAAMEFAVPSYRFVKRYLDRRIPGQLTLRQVDPLIRDLTFYRDLIARRTGTDDEEVEREKEDPTRQPDNDPDKEDTQ
jgi:transposase